MIIDILIMSIAFSIDALGIGLSYGVQKIKIPLISKAAICVVSFVFSAASIWVGDMILLFIDIAVAKVIGTILLASLGVYLVIKAFLSNNNCDFDESKHIDLAEAFYLGATLSVDSLAAGVSVSITGLNSIYIPIFTVIFQALCLSTGIFVGDKLSKSLHWNNNVFIIMSGICLIIVAIVRCL